MAWCAGGRGFGGAPEGINAETEESESRREREVTKEERRETSLALF